MQNRPIHPHEHAAIEAEAVEIEQAAEDYVDKLPVLYSEFAEAAAFAEQTDQFITSFGSATDLMARTPIFWENYVRKKLAHDFCDLYRFLNVPYPDGPNFYIQRIEANMARLKARFAKAAVSS